MKSTEKYAIAVRLLREINCPESIMDALWLWSLTVHDEEIKLNNWIAGENIAQSESILLLREGEQNDNK